jgi:hypothetical protein
MDVRLMVNEDYGFDQTVKRPWLYLKGAMKYITAEGLRVQFEPVFGEDYVQVTCTLKKEERQTRGYGFVTAAEREEWVKEPRKYLYDMYLVAQERALIDATITHFNLFAEFSVPGVDMTHPDIKRLKAELWVVIKNRRIDTDKAIRYITKFEQTPENLQRLIQFFRNAKPEEIDVALGGE